MFGDDRSPQEQDALLPARGSIPVAARRVDEPEPRIVYINAAPAVPAPAAPPQQSTPPIVHHSTIHHHYAAGGTPRHRSSGNSALGMASLALGIIGCVVCWIPVLGLAAVPIGAIGATLGVLGFAVSVVFKQSSPALPVTGLFVSLLAAGISIASTGSLVYWRHQLQQAVRQIQPHTVVSPAASVAMPSNPIKAIRSRPVVTPPAEPEIVSAVAALRSAEANAAQRVSQSNEYQQLTAQAAQARATVKTLREQSPGSSALQDASRRVIDSDNALSELTRLAQLSDPAVRAARQRLAEARHPSTAP